MLTVTVRGVGQSELLSFSSRPVRPSDYKAHSLPMDFTELYNASNNLVAFSPGAHFILNAIHDRIIVRRADTFQITRTWQVDSSPSSTSVASGKQPSRPPASTSASPPPSDAFITHAAWSSDSEYILAACARRGVVNVFKMRDEMWNARIESGAEGLVKAEWSPDGRSIICFSEWGVRCFLPVSLPKADGFICSSSE